VSPPDFRGNLCADERILGLIQRGLDRRDRGEDLDRVSIMDDTLRSAKLPEFMKDTEEFKKQLATLL